jgi:AmiR/NasT family two-component response regulator
MERYKISSDRAFQVLTRASQTRNRKLHDIAFELVTQGSLDH